MIKQISDVNDKLLDVNIKMQKAKSQDEVKQLENTTNNLFVGTTTELQRMLKTIKPDENVIDVEPESETYLGNINVKRDGVQHEFTKKEVNEYVKCVNDPVYFAQSILRLSL